MNFKLVGGFDTWLTTLVPVGGYSKHMLKTLSRFLLAVVLLIILLVIGLTQFINTDQYRPALENWIAEATGYDLTIAGDIGLDFFPNINLSLNDVRLRNPAKPQELASTSEIILRVDRGKLFRGELLIQELMADDFHINYFVDATGANIWDLEDEGAAENQSSSPAANTSNNNGDSQDNDIVSISFESISIQNASIDIQDISQGTQYQINNLNLDSRDTNMDGRPFELDINFEFLINNLSEAVPMSLRSSIVADINAGNVAVNDLNFSVTPMLLSGNLEINNINEALTYAGTLESNSFDMVGLLQTLGLAEVESEFGGPIETVQQLELNLSFNGDQNQFVLDEFLATLGDAEIEADANIRYPTDFTPSNISYNISAGQLDLSSFMTSPEDESGAEAEQATSIISSQLQPQQDTDTELPLKTLRSLNMLGSIYIESLIASDLRIDNITLFTNVEDGVLDIELQPATAYSGGIQGAIRLDGRTPEGVLTTQLSATDLNITEFAPSISRLNSVTGKLNVETDYTSQASSTNTILDTISGSTTFAVTENSVDIGVIKQVFTAIAALSPTGEAIQQWPDVIQFGEMAGYILLENGIDTDQQVKLRMDNFDVDGSGGIDMDAGNFDYNLQFTLLGPPEPQTIPINELYHNVSWPVQCNAAFADEVSQYCRPDFTQVREIFTQIGSNALRSRLQEEITDQVPENLQDAARDLLRNILN